MTLDKLNLEMTPKSGSLKLMYIWDTDEKPEQENIQVVDIHVVLKKRVESYRASIGRNQTGGVSASPTNPEKGFSDNRKIIYVDRPSDVSNMCKNMH